MRYFPLQWRHNFLRNSGATFFMQQKHFFCLLLRNRDTHHSQEMKWNVYMHNLSLVNIHTHIHTIELCTYNAAIVQFFNDLTANLKLFYPLFTLMCGVICICRATCEDRVYEEIRILQMYKKECNLYETHFVCEYQKHVNRDMESSAKNTERRHQSCITLVKHIHSIYR